jgi:hypothetical protein
MSTNEIVKLSGTVLNAVNDHKELWPTLNYTAEAWRPLLSREQVIALKPDVSQVVFGRHLDKIEDDPSGLMHDVVLHLTKAYDAKDLAWICRQIGRAIFRKDEYVYGGPHIAKGGKHNGQIILAVHGFQMLWLTAWVTSSPAKFVTGETFTRSRFSARIYERSYPQGVVDAKTGHFNKLYERQHPLSRLGREVLLLSKYHFVATFVMNKRLVIDTDHDRELVKMHILEGFTSEAMTAYFGGDARTQCAALCDIAVHEQMNVVEIKSIS